MIGKSGNVPRGRSFLEKNFFLARRRFQSKNWNKTPTQPPGLCAGLLSGTIARLSFDPDAAEDGGAATAISPGAVSIQRRVV